MNICILCTDEHVEEVRRVAMENFPELVGHVILGMPVSPDGKLPITHWFCQFKTSQATMGKLMALQNLSEMEIADPLEFLKARNLKIVMQR